MPEISDDDLGLLVACACDYGVRLPHGQVPGHIWSLLTGKWRAIISEQMAELLGDQRSAATGTEG